MPFVGWIPNAVRIMSVDFSGIGTDTVVNPLLPICTSVQIQGGRKCSNSRDFLYMWKLSTLYDTPRGRSLPGFIKNILKTK